MGAHGRSGDRNATTPGLVPAAAMWLFAGAAAVKVSGAVIAESAHELSRPHDVVLSPNGAFLYVADVGKSGGANS